MRQDCEIVFLLQVHRIYVKIVGERSSISLRAHRFGFDNRSEFGNRIVRGMVAVTELLEALAVAVHCANAIADLVASLVKMLIAGLRVSG